QPEDVLLICDEMNLPTGKVRWRAGGSAGGQKGLADVIRHLGTDRIPRVRIGIDRPPDGWEVTDYVLGKFKPSEKKQIDDAVSQAALGTEVWIKDGISEAMNRFNAGSKPNPKPQKPPKPNSSQS
ncbi:MAG: aminoacyl-tRNA hydrolase, partial [Planctomycetota bacterium]